MGRGYSKYAMSEVIEIGFKAPELEFTNIYWYVDKKNLRARRFYDKQNYKTMEANDNMMEKYKKIGEVLS